MKACTLADFLRFFSNPWCLCSNDFWKSSEFTRNGMKPGILHRWLIHQCFKVNFGNAKKLSRWRHCLEIPKNLLKSVISPLPTHAQGSYWCQKKRNASGFKNLWFGAANFQWECRKFEKCPEKTVFFGHFWGFLNFSLYWVKISGTKPKIFKPTCIPLL